MARERLKGVWRDRLVERLAAWGTGLLRLLPPEAAHDAGMFMLSKGLMSYLPSPRYPNPMAALRVRVPGLGDLRHPIGLAAGFDKNARCPGAFAKMGFSFLELGTVTPRPQSGNAKPRMFRLPEQRAIINRMGFNSDGATAVAERLSALKWDQDLIPLGINLGKNKATATENAADDYLQVLETCRDYGRYFVINVSSPNTPGLRDLATPEFMTLIGDLLGADLHKTFVKIDPDLEKKPFQELIEAIADRGFLGLILSNTHRVNWPEQGGQSGHPLLSASNRCLELAYEVHQGKLPMIATGGILSGVDICEKIVRGASCVQIYSALVYRGPWVVHQLLEELAEELKLRGFGDVEEAIGSMY